jgi:hypothetical protein
MDLAPWRDYGLVTGADHWLDGAATQNGRAPGHWKGERIAGCRIHFSTYILQTVSIIGLAATLGWIWFAA